MFTSRPYADEHDLGALIAFLSQARSDIHHAHHLHVGDLIWQLFHMQAPFKPSQIIRLWEDIQGSIVGFVFLYPGFGFFDLEVQAQHRDTELENTMLAWAETQFRAQRSADGPCSTFVHEQDASRSELLTKHGFARRDPYLYMQRSLADAIPSLDIPSGFRVRHLRDAGEAKARAAVLAAAFGAPVETEPYERLMQAPGYQIELDLVAVAPDQRFGAFAMCWIDPLNKVGQFEPVGTAPDFRHMGLGRALLGEGMRRMKTRGAEHVIVIVEEAEQAAQALYGSVGLEPRWRLFLFSKEYQ